MTAKGNLKKLPKLADDERYREALEALRQAETDHREARKEYREADAEFGKTSEGAGPRRLDAEDRREAARREIRSTQRRLEEAKSRLEEVKAGLVPEIRSAWMAEHAKILGAALHHLEALEELRAENSRFGQEAAQAFGSAYRGAALTNAFPFFTTSSALLRRKLAAAGYEELSTPEIRRRVQAERERKQRSRENWDRVVGQRVRNAIVLGRRGIHASSLPGKEEREQVRRSGATD